MLSRAHLLWTCINLAIRPDHANSDKKAAEAKPKRWQKFYWSLNCCVESLLSTRRSQAGLEWCVTRYVKYAIKRDKMKLNVNRSTVSDGSCWSKSSLMERASHTNDCKIWSPIISRLYNRLQDGDYDIALTSMVQGLLTLQIRYLIGHQRSFSDVSLDVHV